MDDPQNIPDPLNQNETLGLGLGPAAAPLPSTPAGSQDAPAEMGRASAGAPENAELQRRSFRRKLFLLLALALGAFALTSWILVRVGAPLGEPSAGPQEIVRAQLRALERGQVRPAYEMFSARYRGQVSYAAWHELVVTHWRMFHAAVVRAGTPAQNGPRVNMEIFLRGADDKDYRARFTLIRAEGRWWIDDVHWTEAAGEHDFSRS